VSSYAGVEFQVFPESGNFPNIERDSDGIRRYHADIYMRTLGIRNDMSGKESRATVLRSYGRLGGVVHLEGGFGSAALTVPVATGSVVTVNAVLVSLTSIQGDGRQTHEFRATAEWVVLS
jgi:hypothetical protein